VSPPSSTRSSDRPRPLALIALALAGVVLGLTTGEIALRVSGFRFSRYPVLQFGYPDPVSLRDRYRTDPVVFWVQKDYDERMKRARELHPSVVFMGDSCTEFGGYPEMTMRKLAARSDLAGGVPVGVSGWSSEQGRAQLIRDVLPLHPRVVTLYFGWNDHWMALGPPDSKIHPPLFPDSWSDRSRLVQFVEHLWFGRPPTATGRLPNRVSPARYEENLSAMIRLAHEAGAQPVLITAPSNHVQGHEPPYLLERHLRRLEDLVPLHREYVELTRRAGQTGHAVVCDAATAFEKLPAPTERYFRRDGIHLTEEGDGALATLLAGCIEQAADPARLH
jgi:lysophospholipase L1-like esterase